MKHLQHKSAPATTPPPHETPVEIRAGTYDQDMIDGRMPPPLTPIDGERENRPLSQQTLAERQESMLDTITEVKHWDLIPGSGGSQVPETSMEDEDDEGRSESEQLAEEGVAEAEREQINLAAKVVRNGNRRTD